jgi:hypothetical protein
MLAQQSFTGNPLCRLSDVPARFRASSRPDNEVSLVVVSGREVVVRSPTGALGPGVHQDLQVGAHIRAAAAGAWWARGGDGLQTGRNRRASLRRGVERLSGPGLCLPSGATPRRLRQRLTARALPPNRRCCCGRMTLS